MLFGSGHSLRASSAKHHTASLGSSEVERFIGGFVADVGRCWRAFGRHISQYYRLSSMIH